MRISDWSSDVCSSDLAEFAPQRDAAADEKPPIEQHVEIVAFVPGAHRGEARDLLRIGIEAEDRFEVGLAAGEFEREHGGAITRRDAMSGLRKNLCQLEAIEQGQIGRAPV